jgi:hypothetical protein
MFNPIPSPSPKEKGAFEQLTTINRRMVEKNMK